MPRGSTHLPPERVEHTTPRASSVDAASFVEEAMRWSDTGGEPHHGLDDLDDPGAGVHPARPFADPARRRQRGPPRLRRRGVGRCFPNVETASNGAEGLERACACPPDLIVSDVMMPVMDGFAMVRALRADDRTKSVPVILLSARAGDESTVEGLDSGADDYLVKPFSARELLARARGQLEAARVRAEVWKERGHVAELQRSVRARDEFISVVPRAPDAAHGAACPD